MTQLLESYLDYLSGTESPTQYHRWSFLTGVGAILSRKVYFNYGHVGHIYPNMYCLLVGSPGTRKDSAIRPVRELVAQAGFTAFASPGRTTAWDFVNALCDGLKGEAQAEDLLAKFRKRRDNTVLVDLKGFGGDSQKLGALDAAKNMLNELSQCEATEGFICLGEFKDFINDDNGEFSTLLTTLWDNPAIYEHKNGRTKKSGTRVINPTVSILGGVTPTGLHSILTEAIAEQGLTSRIILVYGAKPERKVTFPILPDALERVELVQRLEAITELKGEMKLTKEATALLEEIYAAFDEKLIYDARLQYYLSRRLVHLIKLCIILAATDLTYMISAAHVTEANTILAITERFMSRALGEFGESRIAIAKQHLTEKLQALNTPVARTELYQMISNNIDDIPAFEKVLQQLELAKRLVVTKDLATGTRYYQMAADFQPDFKSLPGIDVKYIREILQLEERLQND